jgi:uncharacterized lipoprotein YmbA
MNPMNEPRTSPFGRLAAAVLLGGLAACDVIPPPQEDATRYYVLSAGPAQAASPAQGAARVGLKSVKLEGYLRRREMVVRTGANEVAFRDYRRWAEPLESAVARELTAGMLASPSVAQVYAEPFLSGQERDYDVSVEITRLEGDAQSGRFAASLSAVVVISTAGDSPRVVAHRVFTAPAAAWDGSNYDQLAALLSRDVAELAKAIVADLPPRG